VTLPLRWLEWSLWFISAFEMAVLAWISGTPSPFLNRVGQTSDATRRGTDPDVLDAVEGDRPPAGLTVNLNAELLAVRAVLACRPVREMVPLRH
jgi:hypothetical protein